MGSESRDSVLKHPMTVAVVAAALTLGGGFWLGRVTEKKAELQAEVRYGTLHLPPDTTLRAGFDAEQFSNYYIIDLRNDGNEKAENVRLDAPDATFATVEWKGDVPTHTTPVQGRIGLIKSLPRDESVRITVWSARSNVADEIVIKSSAGRADVAIFDRELRPQNATATLMLVTLLAAICALALPWFLSRLDRRVKARQAEMQAEVSQVHQQVEEHARAARELLDALASLAPNRDHAGESDRAAD